MTIIAIALEKRVKHQYGDTCTKMFLIRYDDRKKSISTL